MTANCHDLPNHFALRTDVTMGLRFGAVHSMATINLPGEGHVPRISVHFRGGVCMDFDTASAIELARRLPEAIAKLPLLPVIHDAVAELEEA